MNKEVEALIEVCSNRFNPLSVDRPMKNQVSFDFEDKDIHRVLAWFKNNGFIQMSLLTCVDWIVENKFQLVYIIFNWSTGIRIQIRTKIDRDKPVFITITNIYPGAKYYERDVHEFFGIEFEGNEDSNKQLFLEGWDDLPPLRKDFNPQVYSDKKYDAREYKKTFDTKRGDSE